MDVLYELVELLPTSRAAQAGTCSVSAPSAPSAEQGSQDGAQVWSSAGASTHRTPLLEREYVAHL